jgi:hypothetical protein
VSDWFTAAQVAAHFDVKPRTVLNWHKDGKIPRDAVQRLGGTPLGRLRFRIDLIEQAWTPGAGGEAPATPSSRPATAIVSALPATPIQGGEDA